MNTFAASPVQTAADQIASVGGSPRLHSLLSIALAVTVGGALASGFLIYRNFVLANRDAAAKRSISLFAIGLIALFTAWNISSDSILHAVGRNTANNSNCLDRVESAGAFVRIPPRCWWQIQIHRFRDHRRGYF